MNGLLWLHILSAIGLWLVSADIAWSVHKNTVSASQLFLLVLSCVATVMTGLILAPSVNVAVCAKIGLYCSPALLSVGFMLIKNKKLA